MLRVRSLLASFAAAALALCALARPPLAQAPRVPPHGRAGQESALERWRRMSPEERETLQRRFEEWKRMDEDERGELRERWHRMRAMEERVLEFLPPEERRRLEAMGPDERREILRERFQRALLERGGELRDKLPPELRSKLERATPEERARILREFKHGYRRAEAARAIETLGRGLELPEGELRRLRALAPEEQERKVLELRRREIGARVEREGLPPFLTREEWSSWQLLSDAEFFERWHARLRSHGAQGPRDRASGAELDELMRPDPSWQDELDRLEPEARRAEIESRLRTRILRHLEAEPERLAPGELEALRQLEGRAFFERLRGMRRERALVSPRQRDGAPRELR